MDVGDDWVVLERELSLTIEERIMLFLEGNRRHFDSYQVPPELTQAGISEAIGVLRPSFVRTVKKMLDKGEVEESKKRVRGEGRKKKTYLLTPPGRKKAAELKRFLGSTSLELRPSRDDEGEETDINRLYRRLSAIGEDEIRFHDLVLGVETLGREFALSSLVSQLIPRHEPAVENLPEVEHFFGRKREYESLTKALGDPDIAVVNVSGLAGIGKTTLVARALGSRKGMNIFWHDVMPVNSAKGLLYDLSRYLGGRTEETVYSMISKGNFDMAVALKFVHKGLDSRASLVVFDDVQNSVPDTRALIKTLAKMTLDIPSLKLVVISRESEDLLDVRWLKRTLDLKLGGLDHKSAMELLQSFRGEPVSRQTFEEVYDLTKGHPLALELLSGYDMKGGFKNFKDFFYREALSGLEDDVYQVLSTLAFFRMPVDRSVFLSLLSDELKETYPRDALNILCDKGFIETEPIAMGKGEWIKVKDMVREYLRVYIQEKEKKRLHSLAASYYDRAVAREVGDGEVEVYNDVVLTCVTERAHHLLEAEKSEECLALAHQYGEDIIAQDYEPFFELVETLASKDPSGMSELMADIEARRGNIDKALEYYDQSLEQKHRTEDKRRSKIYSKMGALLVKKKKWIETIEIEKKGVKLAKKNGDMVGVGRSYNNLGVIYLQWAEALAQKCGKMNPRVKKKVEMAMEYLETARRIFASRGLDSSVSMTLVNIANAHTIMGEREEAREKLSTAMNIVPRGNYAWYNALAVLLELELDSGNIEDSEGMMEEMREELLNGNPGEEQLTASAIRLSGVLRSRDREKAVQVLDNAMEALEISAKVSDSRIFSGPWHEKRKTPSHYGYLCRIALELLELGVQPAPGGDRTRDFEFWEKVYTGFRAGADNVSEERKSLAHTEFGTVALNYGRIDAAVTAFKAALKGLKSSGYPAQEAIVFIKLGDAYRGKGEPGRARRYYKRGLSLAEKIEAGTIAKKARQRLKGR